MPTKKVAYKSKNKSKGSNIRVRSLSSGSNRFNKLGMLVFAVLFAAVLSYVIYRSFAASTTVSVNSPVVGIAGAKSTNDGYWLLGSDGGVFTEGTGTFHGSNPNIGNAVAIVATGDHGGYWLVSAGGNVYAYGDAGYYGGGPSLANCAYNSSVCGTGFNIGEKIVALIPTPYEHGYWLVSNYGRVWSFGDAPGGNTSNGNMVVPGGSGTQPTLNGQD